MMIRETKQINTCLTHLQRRKLKIKNGVLKEAYECCNSCLCQLCIDTGSVCANCKDLGYVHCEPVLRAWAMCVEEKQKCIKAAVICITQDSESRNYSSTETIHRKKTE